MKLIKGFVIAAFAVLPFTSAFGAPASGQDINRHASAEGCVSNCVIVLKHAGEYLLLAKDRSGELFRIENLEVPASARHTGSSSENVSPLGGGSTSQTTQTETYDTPEGTWVVVTVITYDAGGNIINVRSKAMFLPNEQER